MKMKEIKKAVICAAGLGTRMLPISYSVAKELLPIVDLPAIFFLVEEAVNSGIRDILIITAKGKGGIEDFFDMPEKFEELMLSRGLSDCAKRIRKVKESVNLYFLRQNEPRGLGNAVRCAKSFVSDEPFAVLYGDDVIFSETPVVKQLADVYKKYGKTVVGAKEVAHSEIYKYSSLKTEPIGEDEKTILCTDMIEKPKPGEEFSNISILGRVLLTPDVFDVIDTLTEGVGGEIQLTDAIAKMARDGGVYACLFEGERYDLGSKTGFLKANITAALCHPETKNEICEFIKETAKDLQ
jgi:UTP--glucose-1-phosphate uridylyltransferase